MPKLTKTEVLMLHQAVRNLRDVLNIIFPCKGDGKRFENLRNTYIHYKGTPLSISQLEDICLTFNLAFFEEEEKYDKGEAGEESV